MSGKLDIRVEIAPDAEPDGDPEDWEWLDVSSYRRGKTDVEINYGRDDEASAVEAGDASVTFDLRDGLLSPRNPNSELFGRIGTNTPIRLRLPILVDEFDRTVAAGGWGTSTSGGTWVAGSSWSVSGGAGKIAIATANLATEAYLSDVGAIDVDITYSVALSAVTTGAPWIQALEIRRIDADNLYRIHTELKPSGVVTIKLVRRQDAANTDVIEDLTTAATYTTGSKVWTRVVAEGGFLRAKVWSGVLADEPDAWNITSTLVRVEGGGIGFFGWRFVGNTNAGTLTASIDDMTADALLWSGNVPEWPPRWDKSGNDSTMTIAAAGPIRRLNQGDDPLESPLARQLARYSPAGYWTGEDGSDATSMGSAVTNGKPAKTIGVTFASEDTLAGSSGCAKIDATSSTILGTVTGNSTGNWSGMFFVKFPTLPASDTVVIEWRAKTGTFRRWIIRANASGWQIKVYDDTGALALDGGTVAYVDAPTQWTAVQMEILQVGGNAEYDLIWNRVGSETFYAQSGSLAGTSAKISEFYVPGSTGMVDTLMAHFWIGTNDLPFVDATFLAVSDGYSGELASDRISRLCAEQNVALTAMVGDSEALGRQRAGKFLDLLREAAEADLGILYERAYALGYVPRSARYNAPVRLELDWTGGDLAEGPEPTDDDQRLRNRWTVSRVAGSKATYQDDASIARHGAIGDSAEINIEADDRLPMHAGWRTNLTTVDELRWPTVELDLIAHPELRAAFLTCRIGSRITIVNPEDQIAGTEIDLLIEGVKQTIGWFRWDVTLACSPAKPWDVAVWDDPASLWTSRSTTLNTGEDTTSTAWSITTVNREEVWSTSASGYEWNIAGEVVQVSAVAAHTGSGPYVQAVTVVRSRNGVVKAQTAGTVVKMARPTRWAL